MPFSYLPKPDDDYRCSLLNPLFAFHLCMVLVTELHFNCYVPIVLKHIENVQLSSLFSLRTVHSNFISLMITVFPFQFRHFNVPDWVAYQTSKKYISILHQPNNFSLNNQPANSEMYSTSPACIHSGSQVNRQISSDGLCFPAFLL